MLPEGLHDSNLPEIRQALGFTKRREELIDGLERYLSFLESYSVLDSVVIDGSFVTTEPKPGDIDLLVVPMSGATADAAYVQLHQELWSNKAEVRDVFGCDAYPVDEVGSENYADWFTFFSATPDGNARGLLRVGMSR